ncbi:MAG TPA: protease pro-enzyme activation domain-containing protein [Candidatus Acidoferrales bacterium]|nr:protease pro-enzyme activation domain-containing protein [Candidatus Acidoferrales bacterium]
MQKSRGSSHWLKKRYAGVGVFFEVVLMAAISQSVFAGQATEWQSVPMHLPAAATHLQSLGTMNRSQRLNLAIGLPLRNPAALDALLRQLYDPASPSYHHFLTPEQFTERFGPSREDYESVIAFARTNGLTVTARHPNRLLVDVSGSVGDIERVMHLKMQVYQHPTESRTFYAPDIEPTLNLAVPILGISGLNNYSLPRPRLKNLERVTGQATVPNAGSGPGGGYLGNDFRTAYLPDTTLDGSGQIVGLLQFDGYTASDITYYENLAGLPNVTLTNVLIDGADGLPSGNGGEVEVSLDIEMVISMATNVSTVVVYEGPNPSPFEDILNRMATDNLAKQLSCSWYQPGGTADAVADQIFQEMAAQGQSFFNASGDYDAYTGLIDFPGDTPYITEVGGTTLTTGSGGSYVSETVWNRGNGIGSGGGISTQYPIPWWQTNINMTANQGSTTMRNIPDVALTAENIYVRADGVDQTVGGTSCAAPLWAGFAALINQQAARFGKPTIGFVNPIVYAMGATSNYPSVFHDITTGDNTSSSSPTRFYAAPGYDLCTGWGAPVGQKLIDAFVPPVIVTLPSSATEGDGLLTGAGQVRLPGAPTTNVVVTLNSSDPTQVSVPTGFTIPAGQASGTFDLTILDDGVLDGTQTATVTATLPGIGTGRASLMIFDKETATLQVELPTPLTKGQGTVSGTVQVSAPVAADVAVTLSSAGTNLIQLPESVIIPAGQTSAVFTATILTDGRIDGGQSVAVTAHVQNWTDGTEVVTVQDNVNLTVTLPASAWENAGVLTNAGSVSLAGTPVGDQVISLASDKPNKLIVPASVTIPAGSCSNTFNVTLVDNSIADGHQIVTVTAGAPGFTNGSAAILVLDDESPPFPSNPRPGNFATGVPAITNLTWNSSDVGNTQAILNGDFETGTFTNWVKTNSATSGDWVINNGTYVPPGPGGLEPPFAGNFSALSEQTGGGICTLYQDISIPFGASSVTLSWADQIRNLASQYTTNSQYFRVEIRGTNNSLLQIAFTTKPGDPLMNNWTARSFDLSAYMGQTIRIAFVESDSLYYFNVGLDNVRVQVNGPGPGPSGVITNAVYFGTNPAPGPADYQGSTTNNSWTLPLLLPQTTYYWQIIAHRGGSTAGPVWQFTTAGVDHFAWNTIPSPQLVNLPISVSITAKDAFDTTVTNFAGSVALQCLVNAPMLNGGFEAGSLTNWTVIPGSYGSFVINDGTVVPLSPDGPLPPFAGNYSALGDENGPGVFYMYQDVFIPAGVPSATLSWAHRVRNFYNSFGVNQQFQVRICDTNNNVLATAFTTSPGDPLLGDWVQNSYDLTSFSGQTVRVMFWVNPGGYYLDVHVDSVNLRASIPVLPTNSDNFVNGAWSGNLTLPQRATNVVLVADDGSQHMGTSNPFDVAFANDITIRISDLPHPVSVGANLIYTLTVGNTGPWAATGVTVTNVLPVNATFVSATSSQGTCAHSGGMVTGNLGVVPGGTNATITIVVHPTIAGTVLTNLATVSRAGADADLGNNTATVTTPVTTPAISIADASGLEGNVGTTNLVFAVTLAVPCAQTITVDYATTDGTASAGTDYIATNGTVTFSPGTTNQTIAVVVIGNTFVEPNKTFFVNLSNPVNGTLGRSQAVGTIINDDGLPGQVDHFIWSPIASPQFVSQSFAATVTAVDHSNNVVTSFSGTVGLSATGKSVVGLTNILLFEFVNNHYFRAALNELGLNYQAFGSGDETAFNTAVASANVNATLVVFDVASTFNNFGPITTFVNSGGRAIFAFWALDQQPAVAAAFDASVVSYYFAPQPVYDWGNSQLFAGLPNPFELIQGSWSQNGDLLNPVAGGVAAAGFTSSPATDQTALVIGNYGRTILNGFLVDNAQTGSDAVRFAENEIQMLLSGATSAVPISPTNSASFVNGVWTGDLTVLAAATNVVLCADDGNGHIGASNPFDVTSSNRPPVITRQPASQAVVRDQTTMISADASGSPILSYQWMFNRTNIAGATNTSLILSVVQPGQAGVYAVQVTNLYGSTISSNATLTVFLPVTNCIRASSNLVSWWPAEGNTDDAVGTNNGTLVGGAGYTGGAVGQAFYLNGTNACIKVPASGSLDVGPAGGMTIEGWINPAVIDVPRPIAEWNNGSAGGVQLWISEPAPPGNFGAGPGCLYVNIEDTDGNGTSSYHTLASPPGIVQSNVFQHVAFTYDRNSGLAMIYLNGVVVAQQDLGTNFTPQTSYDFYLGAQVSDDPPTLWSGGLDEFSLYRCALSSDEIAAIYSAGNYGKCAPEPLMVWVRPDHKAVLLGCNVVFDALADGNGPLTCQWWKDGHMLNMQTNESLLVTNVQTPDFGNYSVVISDAFGSVTSSPALLFLGHPPVAHPDVIQRFAAGGVRVNAFDLVTNDTDAEGESLTVVEVSSNSTAGGVVGLTNNWVYYAPPPGGISTDTFTYVVDNGGCGTDVGTVTVQIRADDPQPLNFAGDNPNDGSALVRFDGIPGFTYRILYKDSLTAPDWQTLTNLTADGFGVCQFVDWSRTNAPARFYRIVRP